MLLLQACAAETPDFLSRVSTRVITPAFQLLVSQTASQAKSTDEACDDAIVTKGELKQLRHEWLVSMSAWQQVQVFRFGSLGVTATSRQRYHYWPDAGNTIEPAVRNLIDSKNTLGKADIDKADIQVKGFSALEYVLFDKSAAPEMFHKKGMPSAQRCIFLQHVTRKLADDSAILAKTWMDNEGSMPERESGNRNPAFIPFTVEALLSSVIIQLEILKLDKLEKPLDVNAAKRRPDIYLSEAWRSRESLALIRSNVFILGQILDAPQAGLLQLLEQDARGVQLVEKIRKQLLDVNHALLRINISYNESLKSENGIAALHDLLKAIDTLLVTCKNELPHELGITLPLHAHVH